MKNPLVTLFLLALSPALTAGIGIDFPDALIRIVNDADAGGFAYQGAWDYGGQGGAYASDNHWSREAGATCTLDFRGTQVSLYGALDPRHGIAGLSIDQGPEAVVDLYAASRQDDAILFTSARLPQGNHRLTLRVTGTRNPASSDAWVAVDRALVVSRPDPVVTSQRFAYGDLDDPILAPRPIRLNGRTWTMDMFIYGAEGYTRDAVLATSARVGGLADLFGDTSLRGVFEWDYGFHFLDPVGFPRVPEGRADAFSLLGAWFSRHLDASPPPGPPGFTTAMTGHYYYPHYSALWGGGRVDLVSAEIGENIQSVNARIAFTRGASRQYGKPWALQMSPWYGPGILDYSADPVWKDAGHVYSGVHHGHSLELFRRCYYLTYLAGASVSVLEGASVNWFDGDAPRPDGTLSLSPLGLIGREVFAFTHAFTERGIPFTPMAILLDRAHGFGINPGLLFYGQVQADDPLHHQLYGIPFTAAEEMSRSLFCTLWPLSFDPTPVDEGAGHYLVNTPLGDLQDVLLDDAPAAVLERYPVVYLSGALSLEGALLARLTEYVSLGGTLVLNAAQLNPDMPEALTGVRPGSTRTLAPAGLVWLPSGDTAALDPAPLEAVDLGPTTAMPVLEALDGTVLATRQPFGGGSVLVTAPPFLSRRPILAFLLGSLLRPVIPFAITGDIEYALGRNRLGWVLTLINNDGVAKDFFNAAVLDPAQTRTVDIVHKERGSRLVRVADAATDQELEVNANGEFTVEVPPGGVRILQVETD